MFTKLTQFPEEADFSALVGNLEYVKITIDQLPYPINENRLVAKCNSFILAASGSSQGNYYSCIGLRPDKEDIDEHPIVFYYDKDDSSRNFGGIIHHGDWDGRTTPMEQWQLDAMATSGMTAQFTYKGIAPKSSGSLDDLAQKRMLTGLSRQFELLKKQKNES